MSSYGDLSFIALDSVTKKGTTEFTIANISKVGDLSYIPPERIDLIPDEFLGDVDFYPNQTRVSNGKGDRAISTLIRELGIDLTDLEIDSSELRTDLTQHRADTTALGTDSADLGIGLTQHRAQTTDLATDSSELRINLTQQETDVTKHRANTTEQGADLSGLETDLTGWETDVTKQGTETTDLATDLTGRETGLNELEIDLSNFATEGSYATWEVNNGTYSVTYSLYASEDDIDRDHIYFYDGNSLSLFDSRSSATIQSSQTRWLSESKTVDVEVTGGELTFITLDTVDKSGTTWLRITNIEKLAEENNPYEYIYEEPPDPIPETGKDLGDDYLTGLDLGTLKPWETDELTGLEYNQGYVYPSYHLGASYITEYIGADDLTDYVNFTLEEDSYLNFFHTIPSPN